MKKPKKRKKESAFEKSLKRKKRLLYFVLLLTFFFLSKYSISTLSKNKDEQIKPEIDRAVLQISGFMPQLQSNEKALRDTYIMMEKSRKAAARIDESAVETASDDQIDVEELIDGTLSWIQRVTKFKVGRDGTVMVVSKEDGTILAHPEEEYVGKTISALTEDSQADFIGTFEIPELDGIRVNQDGSIDNLPLGLIVPNLEEVVQDFTFDQVLENLLQNYLYGTVISYKDVYIICGIPLMEYIEDCLLLGVYVSFIIIVILWVFVKYILFLLEARREGRRALFSRLLTVTALVCAVIFLTVWYIQVIVFVTKDIKTMDQHANVALETLNTYKEQRQWINEWLDGQYLEQCRIAADYVKKNEGRLTRKSLQKLSEVLCIKHIYVFDKEGKVIVTNSPYDHFVISGSENDQSFTFRPMLEGAEYLIQEPSRDDVTGEYTQFIAVGLRDSQDLYNGFVQIAIDPELRDNLIKPLSIDTVLRNLVIGLPKYAVAINKSDMTIAATTGLGFVGQPISKIGISEENLQNNFNGFLHIDGTGYYAGAAETSDLFLVPIVPMTRNTGTLGIAAGPTFISGVVMVLLSLLSMIGYSRKSENEVLLQDNADYLKSAEAERRTGTGGENPGKDPVQPGSRETDAGADTGGMTKDEDDEDNDLKEEVEDAAGMVAVSRLSRFLKAQEKVNYNERWRMNNIPVSKQTPEQKVGTIIYRLILIICLTIIVPQLYHALYGETMDNRLIGLSYVIAGNWEKGFNIFSFSSLFFLLCEMYVFVVLMNQFLYRLGKVTDMRTETICLLIKNSLKYICVVIFVFYGLSKFGVKTNTLWTSAGIFSVVIGFGAKDLMNDLISGFFIIFEGTFKVGDYITVGSWNGIVQEIGLRTTRVGFFGDTKIINNSSIKEVVNADGKVVILPMFIPVSYDQDLTMIEAVLSEELPKMMDTVPGLLEPPKYQKIDSFQDSSIMLRIQLTIDRKEKMNAKRSFNREIKLMFDRRGIEIPFSQIVVHYAKDGNGPQT